MDDLAGVSEGRFRAAGKRITNQRRLLPRILAALAATWTPRGNDDRARGSMTPA